MFLCSILLVPSVCFILRFWHYLVILNSFLGTWINILLDKSRISGFSGAGLGNLNLTIQRWYFFCGSFVCFLCLVLGVLSRLFLAALWSPAGRGLTSWLLIVMIMFLSLSHVVSWVRCGTWLYSFLIFVTFLTLIFSVLWLCSGLDREFGPMGISPPTF